MTDRISYPIVLIGPMGSGKSKIGKKVAKALSLPFIDTDKRIVEKHGPITEIFAEHGETHFRGLEREAVRAALTEHGIVSLGGGAVLDPDTRDDLRNTTVILLTVTPEAVAARIKLEKRPLLADGMDAWNRIYEERRDLYQSLATVTFDTSQGPMKNIADTVTGWIVAHDPDLSPALVKD